jgi:acyl-CoA thioesterase-1
MSEKVPMKSSYNSLTKITILMGILLFSSNVFADKDKTIVIIGDSLSAAHNIPIGTAWPQLLQKKLNAKNYPYKIINTSISGDTSYTALNRSEKMLPTLKPAMCLIAIGANDGLQGLTLKQLKNNLHKLVTLCQQYTNKVMLVEMKLPSNYGQAFVTRFTNVYHQVAKEDATQLIPFFMEPFALDLSMFLKDRVHPTEQAQPIMANIVWEGIVEFLN